jgi:hypothetical protein
MGSDKAPLYPIRINLCLRISGGGDYVLRTHHTFDALLAHQTSHTLARDPELVGLHQLIMDARGSI